MRRIEVSVLPWVLVTTRRVLSSFFGRNPLVAVPNSVVYSCLFLPFPSVSSRFVTFNRVPSFRESPLKQERGGIRGANYSRKKKVEKRSGKDSSDRSRPVLPYVQNC